VLLTHRSGGSSNLQLLHDSNLTDSSLRLLSTTSNSRISSSLPLTVIALILVLTAPLSLTLRWLSPLTLGRRTALVALVVTLLTTLVVLVLRGTSVAAATTVVASRWSLLVIALTAVISPLVLVAALSAAAVVARLLLVVLLTIMLSRISIARWLVVVVRIRGRRGLIRGLLTLRIRYDAWRLVIGCGRIDITPRLLSTGTEALVPRLSVSKVLQ